MNNPFIPSNTDGAMALLYMVFGDVVAKMGNGTAPLAGTASNASVMLAEAFRYFDSGVLVFGTFILTWVTIFGVTNSANDGEVLGKTWNTFYTPIRSVSAAAVLIPSSSGYALIQIFMLYVVSWSIGFASTIWTGVVNVALSRDVTQTALNSVISDTNFDNIMSQAIRMGTCASAMNKAITSIGQTADLEWQVRPVTDTHLGTKTVGSVYYYADPNVPGTESLCGSITLTDTQPVVMNSIFGGTWIGGKTANNDAADKLRDKLAAARNQFYMATFTSFVPSQVQQIMAAADGGAPVNATALATNLASFKTQLRSTMQDQITQSIQGQNSDLASSLTSQGWIMAGSYWSDLGKLKDIVRSSSDSKISTSAPDTMGRQSFFGSGQMFDAANSITSRYEVVAAELTKQALASPAINGTDTSQPAMPTLQSDFTLNDFTGGGQGILELFRRAFNFLPGLFVSGIVHAMSLSDDPVMAVKNVGDWITTLSNTTFLWKTTVTSVLSGVSEAASTSSVPLMSTVAGVIKGVATWFADTFGFMSPSLYTIMYLGYFLGIWLPMIPFYIFAIGVVGWLIFVVEMMAAGMLWAAAHTTPARDSSFIGSQMQGYMLLMSGFFRPSLMIIGLVAANAILYPAVVFVNYAFLAKFTAMQQDSLTVITSVAGYLLVYTFLMFSVFTLVFGLSQSLPDRILRWVGAGVGDLGEQNSMSKVEHAASSQSRAAMVKGMQFDGERASADQRKQAAQEQKAIDDERHSDMMKAMYTLAGAAPVTDTGPGANITRE